MKKDKVVILGSTGSIGTQSIDVINSVGDKNIIGLACNSNIKLLYKQVKKTNCKYVSIYDEQAAKDFTKLCKKKSLNIKIFQACLGLSNLQA